MNRPHVLFVVPSYNAHGGLERYNHDVVQALTSAGATVHAVCLYECTRPEGDDFSARVLRPKWWRANIYFGRIWPHLLKRYLSHYDACCNLVVAAHVFCLPAALDFARRRGVPCWNLAFGLEVWGEIRSDYALALREAERLITISEYTRKRIIESSGRQKTIDIIAPAVDVDEFIPKTVSRQDDTIRLLTVGRLQGGERSKGHDLVIDALGILRTENIQGIEYWIVGEGPDLRHLERIAHARGVNEQVKFCGRVDDRYLPDIYNQCDIFVMPSFVAQNESGKWTGEGFGIVYIEASACEKPVIGCTEGGQTDCIIDGETGLLVEPTAESVAMAIRKLVDDRVLAREMGRKGRKYVLSHFTRDHFNVKWRGLLNSDVS